jgi:hypothetical protein
MYAPIVLFVYNRPAHTRQTVEALQKNSLAQESDLVIFSDAEKNPEAAVAVRAVREYIRQIGGFKSIKIIERDKNWGLANSIIDGVTSVVNEYGRIIVLEDDMIVSPYFLGFMNRALDYYLGNIRVWHISGWNFPISPEGITNTFFSRAMYCWGWATWADRWKNFQKEPHRLMAEWDKSKIRRFNLDGNCEFWDQVKNNALGTLNTWGVFWYATIFEHDGLCLNPAISYVENIGQDKSGENCDDTNIYSNSVNQNRLVSFPESISESALALTRTQQFCSSLVVPPTSLMSKVAKQFKNLLS